MLGYAKQTTQLCNGTRLDPIRELSNLKGALIIGLPDLDSIQQTRGSPSIQGVFDKKAM
jgi:hypothetical protein